MLTAVRAGTSIRQHRLHLLGHDARCEVGVDAEEMRALGRRATLQSGVTRDRAVHLTHVSRDILGRFAEHLEVPQDGVVRHGADTIWGCRSPSV